MSANPTVISAILAAWLPEWSALTGQAGADAYNTATAATRARPVDGKAFAAWAAVNRRLIRLQAFSTRIILDSEPGADAKRELQGAVYALLFAANNPTAYLDLSTGSDQRTLLLGSVQLGVLEASEIASLLAKSLSSPDATADDFAAALARKARQTQATPHQIAAQEFQNALAAWVESGEGNRPEYAPPSP